MSHSWYACLYAYLRLRSNVETLLKEPVLVLGDTKGAAHVLNNMSTYFRPVIDNRLLTLFVCLHLRNMSYCADNAAYT